MTLGKANLDSGRSILLPGMGTHRHQINYSVNFTLPLTEEGHAQLPAIREGIISQGQTARECDPERESCRKTLNVLSLIYW